MHYQEAITFDSNLDSLAVSEILARFKLIFGRVMTPAEGKTFFVEASSSARDNLILSWRKEEHALELRKVIKDEKDPEKLANAVRELEQLVAHKPDLPDVRTPLLFKQNLGPDEDR